MFSEINNDLGENEVVPFNQKLSSDVKEISSNEILKRAKESILKEQNLSFRLGQTGLTYHKLFAPYLKEANEITIEDPFIRTSWQSKNFMEFVTMIIDTRPVDELIINLITNEEDDKVPELIDKLDDIKDDLAEYGIVFNYKLRTFHYRFIQTGIGWTITLRPVLDIF